MPTKQSKKQAMREARARAARQEKIIKGIAVFVVVALVAIAIWMLLPKQPSNLTINVNKQYFATVRMQKGGEFVIQLFPDKAPITVDNFVKLARQGFYDGTTFHRVIEGFMAQGGDPTGTGTGGPGYQFQDEISDLLFDQAGLVAMANSGPNTNGSQFFITYAPTSWLDGKHTIFGRVIEGMEVVESLTPRDPSQNPDYPGDVIESVTIMEQ